MSKRQEMVNQANKIEPAARRDKTLNAAGAWLGDSAQQDGRGCKSSALGDALKTMRQLVKIQGWVDNERYRDIHQQLRKTLKHIDHGAPWEQIAAEASKAEGLVKREGRKRNKGKEYGPGDPVVLNAEYTAYPINSVAKMESAGKLYGNCLRSNEWGHHDDLRDLDASYWDVRKADNPVACLRADHDGEVTEMLGPRNGEADLPAEVLWALCRMLEISGDEHQLFHRSGVLSLFVEGKAVPDKPELSYRGYCFWARRREVVVHCRARDLWSRFVWSDGQWQAGEHSALAEDALDIMRDFSPAVRTLFQRAEPRRRVRIRKRRAAR